MTQRQGWYNSLNLYGLVLGGGIVVLSGAGLYFADMMNHGVEVTSLQYLGSKLIAAGGVLVLCGWNSLQEDRIASLEKHVSDLEKKITKQ